MIFIRAIVRATNQDWSICDKCTLINPASILCGECLTKRSDYFHAQCDEVENSLEYRFRAWLSKLLKPELKFK